MVLDRPIFAIILGLFVVLQVGYIIIDSQINFKSFRDYMDAIIILAFFVASYFLFEYFRNKNKVPKRGNLILKVPAAQVEISEETKKKVNQLLNSEEYKKYEQNKKKSVSKDETDSEEVEDRVREVLGEFIQKQVQIFEE